MAVICFMMKKITKLLTLTIFFLLLLLSFDARTRIARAACDETQPGACYNINRVFHGSCQNSSCHTCSPECDRYEGGSDTDYSNKIHNPFLPSNLSSLTGVGFLQKFLNLAITLCLVVGGVIFFFMLLSGGIRWIASSGDKTQLEEARKQITHALIGMALLLSTFAIIQLIQSLFGVSLLNISLPTL